MRWIDTDTVRSQYLLPDLHPLVARTLARRGMTTPESARAFLDPDAYTPSPAAALPGLVTAANRVERAIRSDDEG